MHCAQGAPGHAWGLGGSASAAVVRGSCQRACCRAAAGAAMAEPRCSACSLVAPRQAVARTWPQLFMPAALLPHCPRRHCQRCTFFRGTWGWWKTWPGTRGMQTCLARWVGSAGPGPWRQQPVSRDLQAEEPAAHLVLFARSLRRLPASGLRVRVAVLRHAAPLPPTTVRALPPWLPRQVGDDKKLVVWDLRKPAAAAQDKEVEAHSGGFGCRLGGGCSRGIPRHASLHSSRGGACALPRSGISEMPNPHPTPTQPTPPQPNPPQPNPPTHPAP